jgi:hypothetical protein
MRKARIKRTRRDRTSFEPLPFLSRITAVIAPVAESLEESGRYNHEMPEKNPQPSDPLRLNPEPVPKPQPEPAPPDTDKTEKKKRPKRKKRG